MSNKQKIKIDVISDINCPWCYLGEERLKKAVKATETNYEFEISFKPFELSPNAPQQGLDKTEYFIKNYGPDSLDRLPENNRRLTEAGRAEGITFDFDKSNRVHNTFNGHRLIWLAGKYGVQDKVTAALYQSNFTEGKNMNDTALLKAIGIAAGIPAEKLDSFFESEEGKKEVKLLEQEANMNGIRGVPAFIINNQYLISGAQPTESFVSAFRQIAPALQEFPTQGDSCEIGGNC